MKWIQLIKSIFYSKDKKDGEQVVKKVALDGNKDDESVATGTVLDEKDNELVVDKKGQSDEITT